MEEISKKLLKTLKTRQNHMVEQLFKFCTINSGSENLPGLALMNEALHKSFKPLADKIETLSFPDFTTINMNGNIIKQKTGNALFIHKRQELPNRILLCGHMDTVYNHGSNNELTILNERQIQGPGVADMKGGLVVILEALKIFEDFAAAKNIGWDLLINADEELGSPASSNLINKIALNYQAALVYEPAVTVSGIFARNRWGSGKLTLIAKGRSAHVGRAFDQGRNAICYLAKIILAIADLNKQHDGIIINIGKIAGGSALNIVPEQAVAKLDIRIAKPKDEKWVWENLNQIKQKFHHDDYELNIYGNFSRPVKIVTPATKKFFSILQTVGKNLGSSIHWQDSGGCCDGNNLAGLNVPVIDTLGVCGGNLHSAQEFMEIESLVERTALTALLLLNLATGGLKGIQDDVISQCP